MSDFAGLIVFLGTYDLSKVDHFYSKLLGLPLYKDQGLCRIYSVPGGGKLGFCSHLPVAPPREGPIITLVTSKVDEVYRRLISEGVQPEAEPSHHPKFNIYHFFVKDSDGYSVEIQRFL